MRKRQGFFCVALSHVLLLSGCGYSLQSRLSEAFAGPEGIFVPVFENRSEEVGVEVVFTDALIRELQVRGQVRILPDRKDGAKTLIGSVDSVAYSPSVSVVPGFKGLRPYRRLPSEIVVSVHCTLRLTDSKGAQLWGKGFDWFRRVPANTTRTYDYQAPSSLGLMTQSLIEFQYPLIARDMMRDVYDEIVDLF